MPTTTQYFGIEMFSSFILPSIGLLSTLFSALYLCTIFSCISSNPSTRSYRLLFNSPSTSLSSRRTQK